MTAAEARKLATEAVREEVTNELDDLFGEIEEAANEGCSSLEAKLSVGAITKLRSMGYTVSYDDDTTFYTVTWGIDTEENTNAI
jgi:hypothetical protein